MSRMTAFLFFALACSTAACSAPDTSGGSNAQPLRNEKAGAAADGTCTQDGAIYRVGESVPSGDSCNSCGCNAGGIIACTTMACEPPSQPPPSSTPPSPPSEDVCVSDGKTYQVGESVPSGDSCNTCGCNPGGIIACTTMACEPPSQPPPSSTPPSPPSEDVCVSDGKTYQVGESVPSGDGCNTCGCNPGGTVACTTMACP